jgi:ankyrin repeat protein
MKKLLLFSLLSLSVAIPAIAMNVASEHTPGLYVHPLVNKFTGNDAPDSAAVRDIVYDTQAQIRDLSIPDRPEAELNAVDSNGRNVIWWAALMGKKNLYNELVKIGANPDIKSTSGLIAGFSARQLIQMSPQEIEDVIEAGPNAAKAKL